jgi:hypothetical protein
VRQAVLMSIIVGSHHTVGFAVPCCCLIETSLAA